MPKTVMTHNFSDVPRADIPRSTFDRSHGYKTTFNAGLLIPFYCDEALPGDTFNYQLTAFARLATPIKPVMDNMFMETFFFSVPVRQVWDNWEKFHGEQDNPGDPTDFIVPHVSLNEAQNVALDIYDYMGLPPNIDNIRLSALHLRAYNHIFNNWFKNQNLVDEATFPTDDGPDPEAHYNLRRRAKRPDYFTSCLPFPQKGESVTIPIAGEAPVIADPDQAVFPLFQEAGTAIDRQIMSETNDENAIWGGAPTATTLAMQFGTETGLLTDLTDATGVSVNELRQSFQIQKYSSAMPDPARDIRNSSNLILGSLILKCLYYKGQNSLGAEAPQ